MTDRDWPALCRRIAEALEPEPKEWIPYGAFAGMYVSGVGMWCVDLDGGIGPVNPDDYRCEREFNSDPIAALALVEAFGSHENYEDMNITIKTARNDNGERDGYHCYIVNEYNDCLAHKWGKDIPEAITLAVARALGVDERESQ